MNAAEHPSMDMERIESLTDLACAREIALGCVRCGLAATRTRVAFGEGDAGARIMLVGEGPGAEEDAQGRPFVGRAGRILEGVLIDAGLSRDRVWITNIVHCRPVNMDSRRARNRAPRADEIQACSVWMDAELRMVNPRVVVCLGAIAAKVLLRAHFLLTRERGRWFPGPRGTEALATFHPSYVLRMPDAGARQRARETLLDDIARAARRAEEHRE